MTAQLLTFPAAVRRPDPACEPLPPEVAAADAPATLYNVTLRDQQVAVLFAGEYVAFDSVAELKADVLRDAAPSRRAIRHTARASLAARIRARRARRVDNIVWAVRSFVLLPALIACAGALVFVAVT
jgi:hypothetical protein